MKTTPDGFELRVKSSNIDVVGAMTRTTILRYRTSGTDFERIQPIALNGRDFVDEWLQSDWNDAVRWNAPQNVGNLNAEHSRIEKIRKSESNSVLFTYGPVRACSDSSKHFQVELDQDPGSPIYYQISETGNGYSMLSASGTPSPTCKSADLMPH